MMLVYAFYFTCNIHTITLKKQFIVWKVRKSVILWNRKPHPGSILNIIINMNEIEFKVNLKGKKNLYSSTLTMQYLTNLQFLKYLKQENIRSSSVYYCTGAAYWTNINILKKVNITWDENVHTKWSQRDRKWMSRITPLSDSSE